MQVVSLGQGGGPRKQERERQGRANPVEQSRRHYREGTKRGSCRRPGWETVPSVRDP